MRIVIRWGMFKYLMRFFMPAFIIGVIVERLRRLSDNDIMRGRTLAIKRPACAEHSSAPQPRRLGVEAPESLDEAVRLVKARNTGRESELIYKLPAPDGKEYSLVPFLTDTGLIGLVYGVGAKGS